MEPVDTKLMRRILQARGCSKVAARGSHEKWVTPGGLSNTIVGGARRQSPGVVRNIQRVFAPEFGERWLERELGR